jgi:hypothetical protein
MTRTSISMARSASQNVDVRKGNNRHRRVGVRVEGLETRLALSSYATGPVSLDLNPQPLPPGIVIVLAKATPSTDDWNAPTSVRFTSGVASPALNPQPLPPGFSGSPHTAHTTPVLWQDAERSETGTDTLPKKFEPLPTCSRNCFMLEFYAAWDHEPSETFPPDPI